MFGQSIVPQITALAGGGQTGATKLYPGVNRVNTVVNAKDSVMLPMYSAGCEVLVHNDSVNPLAVFGRDGASGAVLAGGDTIDGIASVTGVVIPPNSSVLFAASGATGDWLRVIRKNQPSQYVKNTTAGATTAAAGDLTGADYVKAEYSAVGTANLTTRTAAQMIADGGLKVGDEFHCRIVNSSAGTTTLVGGTGVTVTGTATLATATYRDFDVKVNSATTMTFQNVGSGSV